MERKRLQSSSSGEEDENEKEEISPKKRKCVPQRPKFDDDKEEDKHNQTVHEKSKWSHFYTQDLFI